MKRIFNIFLCTCIAIVAATSCQKSIDDERSATPKDNVDGQIEIRVGASLGEYSPVGATKAVLVNTLRASWDGGETIYVFDGERCLGTLKAALRDGHSEFAILSTDENHTVEKPADGTSVLTLVYSPALKEKPEVTDGALTVSLAKQDGSETPFVTYATLDYNGEKSIVIENMVLPFKFATSVVQFNCTCDNFFSGLPLKTAVLSNVNTMCKLTFSAGAAPSVSGTSLGQIFKNGDDNIKTDTKGAIVFQMDVPVLDETQKMRPLIVRVSNGSIFIIYDYKDFSQEKMAAGTSFNSACQLKRLKRPDGYALNSVFTINPNGDKVFFSSGNLCYMEMKNDSRNSEWSFSTQFGRPLDDVSNYYGDIFVVGEKYNTYKAAVKNVSWTYYRQTLFGWGCNTPWESGGKDESYSWPTDGSDPWGSKVDDKGTWRTLTIDEWKYLLGNTLERAGKWKPGVRIYDEWQTKYMTGLVIAPDDFPETIKETYTRGEEWDSYQNLYGLVFLPCSGWRSGTHVVNYVDDYSFEFGRYWSSTQNESKYSWCVWIDHLGTHIPYCDPDTGYWVQYVDFFKSVGCSVRLVSDVKY